MDYTVAYVELQNCLFNQNIL